jgi:hypothetical protein
LLLAAMEGFTQAGTAAILGVPETELAGLLALEENDPADTPASRICIIEDEPLTGASLSRIVTSLGHLVAGVVSTRNCAVRKAGPDPCRHRTRRWFAGRRNAPYAGRSGDLHHRVPERLLSRRNGEPTFLIPEPFKPSQVKAVITQTLILRGGARAWRRFSHLD